MSTEAAPAAALKSCCANLYSSEAVRLLVGESFHPGGIELTRRLADLLDLRPGDEVLDIASGPGTSAVELASSLGCSVTGVELSASSRERAEERAAAAGVQDRVRFVAGDAERLPVDAAAFDAVICECAFCTFPGKSQAAAEIQRVLRPGGRVGLSDLTRRADLPEELKGLLAWVACVADAGTVEEYMGHLRSAGLVPGVTEDHSGALLELAEQISSRLSVLSLASQLGQLALPQVGWADARAMAASAMTEIRNGNLGYAILVARKP